MNLLDLLGYTDYITPAKSLIDNALGRTRTVRGDRDSLNRALAAGEKISNVSFLPGGVVVYDVEVER